MQAKAGGKRSSGGVEEFGELSGKLCQMGRVKGRDVGQKHGPVGEVLGHCGVAAPAAGDGLESEIRLLLEELQ